MPHPACDPTTPAHPKSEVDYRARLIGKPIHAVFLGFFVLFGSFGVVALLTGVISEAMFLKSEVKEEVERMEKQLARRQLLDGATALFDEFVHVGTHSTMVSYEQLPGMIPRIEALLEQNQLPCDPHDLQDMIELMDTAGSGMVSRSEFCRSVLHIAENSDDLRPMLTMELHNDKMAFLKRIFQNVNHMQDETKRGMEAYLKEALEEQQAARAEMKDFIKQALRDQLPLLLAHMSDSRGGGSLGKERRGRHADSELSAMAPTSELYQLQADVRGLQADIVTLSGRVEEMMGQGKTEQEKNNLQELYARRQMMQLESTLDVRVSRVETELRKVGASLEEIKELVLAGLPNG